MSKKKCAKGQFFPSMYQKDKDRPSGKKRVLVFDIEAIGLLDKIHKPEHLHVIHCKDFNTGEEFQFFDPKTHRVNPTKMKKDGKQDGFIQDGVKMLQEAGVLIIHNGIGYDFPAIKKTFPWFEYDVTERPRGKKLKGEYAYRIMDTMIMSQLLNPDRKPPHQAYALGRGNVGPHSIEAHGIRMGRYKPENEDWSHLNDHMLHRASEDVAIGLDLYDCLLEEWFEVEDESAERGLALEEAYYCEVVFGHCMALQQQRGFVIDINWCHKIYHELDKKIEEIVKKVEPHLPLRIAKKKLNHSVMKKAADKAGKPYLIHDCEHGSQRSTNWGYVTKAGHYSSYTKKDFPEETVGHPDELKDPVVVGPYTPVVWERVSVSSRVEVRKMLYKLGWLGVNLTETESEFVEKNDGLPYPEVGKIDTDSMEAWEKRAKKKGKKIPSWAKEVITYFILVHRRSIIANKSDLEVFREKGELPKGTIRGLIGHATDIHTGVKFTELLTTFGYDYWEKAQWPKCSEFSVPAVAMGIGTNTFRCRHKVVVNIPTRGLYGKEMRRIFIPRKGFKLLGIDGSGLELRMLAHFMNDDDYTKVLLEGDIHTHNQEMAGLKERDLAKTFIYAFLYGSGVLALAVTLGLQEKTMKEVVERFLASLPALHDLQEGVKKVARERGYMVAVDGRRGYVRRSGGEALEHTALNVLLQMTGSLCMKWSLVLLYETCRAQGRELNLVANVHDEIQQEVPAKEVKEITYKIAAKDWKAEEKRDHEVDGEFYSAPEIIGKNKKETKLKLRRRFHPMGHISKMCFRQAGTKLGIRVPLDGEYKIGDSWAETH